MKERVKETWLKVSEVESDPSRRAPGAGTRDRGSELDGAAKGGATRRTRGEGDDEVIGLIRC